MNAQYNISLLKETISTFFFVSIVTAAFVNHFFVYFFKGTHILLPCTGLYFFCLHKSHEIPDWLKR